ncbi:carbon storage regulator homolog [Sporomusaceae bacterium FL31]|nr:carbon storage regulator homolog [Sporomusaceae bacterium FL31]GCE33853.1 carbon storage regulator homolog [Sporomusaceae bacterium]
MLALTRKIGERIVIGDQIVLTVVDIKGDTVRVAIEAPKVIKIYRGEIYDSIVAENKQASEANHLDNLDILKGFHIKK